MRKFMAIVGLAMLCSTSAQALNIVDVEVAYGNYSGISVPGYGQPWATPLIFTDSKGHSSIVFCDDLNHDISPGYGQNLMFSYGPVKVDGIGNALTVSQSATMGRLAGIGRADYLAGNEDAAMAAQGAIWAVEYKVPVTSSNPAVQGYLTAYESIPVTGSRYAMGLLSQQGYQSQIIGTPEPSTWVMMLCGFVMLGWSAYHHGKREKVEG